MWCSSGCASASSAGCRSAAARPRRRTNGHRPWTERQPNRIGSGAILSSGQLLAQGLHLLEALRDITEDCGDSGHAPVRIVEWQDRELDRDPRAVLSQRWDGEDIARAVARLAAAH